MLFAIITLLLVSLPGCETTGDIGTDLKNAGAITEKIGEDVPEPVGSWIELVGAVLITAGTIFTAQEKRVRNEKKKVVALECKVCDLEEKGA